MKKTGTLLPTGLEEIKTKIHEIRGQKVMLDKDLAYLYGIETRRLNEQVKRNRNRFPEDFMFQLSQAEFENWISQNATSNSIKMGARKRPFAFTELGIAMLSSVLSSELAIQMNIRIMRAFVFMKKNLPNLINLDLRFDSIDMRFEKLQNYIDEVLHDQNDINEDTATQLELINQALAELQVEKTNRKNFENRKPIGFKIND